MAQIFHPSTNTISKASIFGAIFILAGMAWVSAEIERANLPPDILRGLPGPAGPSRPHGDRRLPALWPVEPPGPGSAIAISIALVKAALVVLYFMHVRVSTRLTKLFAVMGLLWLAILFSLTLNDYLTRSWFEVSRGWTDAPGLLPPGR